QRHDRNRLRTMRNKGFEQIRSDPHIQVIAYGFDNRGSSQFLLSRKCHDDLVDKLSSGDFGEFVDFPQNPRIGLAVFIEEAFEKALLLVVGKIVRDFAAKFPCTYNQHILGIPVRIPSGLETLSPRQTSRTESEVQESGKQKHRRRSNSHAGKVGACGNDESRAAYGFNTRAAIPRTCFHQGCLIEELLEKRDNHPPDNY